jgi:hypothetical protein
MGRERPTNGDAVAAVEQAVRAVEPGALLVEPRLLRRVIKTHHRLVGLGVAVPHDRCLALGRAELLAIVGPERLGPAARDLPETAVLLQRPHLNGEEEDHARALSALWRVLFHSRVHVELQRRMKEGKLTDAAIRKRVHRIGQTEFDEIRLVLRQDNHLLPPYGDRTTYVEFAALYLELRLFAPRTLTRFFPTLDDLEQVDAVLGQDVDAQAVLAATRPAGAELPPAEPAPERLAVHGSWWEPASPVGSTDGAEAAQAEQVGNLVRAAILTLQQERRAAPAARDAARVQIAALAAHLAETVGLPAPGASETRAAWVERATAALVDLADAAAGRGGPRRTVEARLLHDLQRACTEGEIRTVDVVGWALSLGRRQVVRSLPALRVVRIARHLRAAEKKLARIHLPETARRAIAAVVHDARFRADVNVRAALAPRIERVLEEVGFVARNVPERVARRKLMAELLDQVVERGTFGIGHLRDAVSRNALKLPDLSTGDLLRGDQLLRADRRLTDALDGVYRGGTFYMRFLQRVSSLLFGTWLGRQLTLYFILPLGAAFLILEGLNHIVGPLAKWISGHRVHLLTRWSFSATALALFLLLHSPAFRRGALWGLRALRWVLASIFWRSPRWLFTRPVVLRVARSRPFRLLLDYVVKPAVLVAPFWLLWWAIHLDHRLSRALLAEGALFFAVAVLFNSRYGRLIEEAVADAAQRTVHHVRAHILPGLFNLIVQVFRSLLDGLERVLYAVDEWLRFRRGDSVIGQIGKGLFGIVWFVVTYVVRIYVNLLIEPQVNPIKHFPVVTVSHKIILPMSPTFIAIFRVPLMPLGPVVANTFGAVTTVLLPGVFGFLVWEFKENWKLYRGEGDKPLAVARIGHHGEAMGALLRPGFHSGTVPKLYTKLRRATWRGDATVGKHQEEVHHTAEAVKKFVEREWVGLMMETPRWGRSRPVSVGQVELGSNRIRVELRAPSVAPESAWLVFEEQSGWIMASIERDAGPSWLGALDAEGRRTVEAALCGLYAIAGVQLVREQIEGELGAETPYDIADEGLVVWPGGRYETEIVYDLRGGAVLRPTARGAAPEAPPAELQARQIRFCDHPMRWKTWVDAWREEPGAELLQGARLSLLPPNLPRAAA